MNAGIVKYLEVSRGIKVARVCREEAEAHLFSFYELSTSYWREAILDFKDTIGASVEQANNLMNWTDSSSLSPKYLEIL